MMKAKRRLLAVILAAAIVLVTVPFAFAATDGATLAVMHGATKRLELYKMGSHGVADRSYLYSNFTSATSGNEKVCKFYQSNGKFYVVGYAQGATTYTVTTDEGETFSGVVNVFREWEQPIGGGSSGGTGYVGNTLTASAYGSYVLQGKTLQFTGVFNKATFSAADYTWSTSDSTIGTVDSAGLFTAKSKSGLVSVYAKDKKDGTIYTAVIRVASADDIYITPDPINLTVGQSATATANYYVSNSRTGTWSSSDTSVATVSTGSGKTTTVYGAKVGTATLTFKDSSNNTATVKVNVTNAMTLSTGNQNSSVTYNNPSLQIYVNGYVNSNVSWQSSNTNVLQVSSSGLVSRASGYWNYNSYVTVTATDTSTNQSASITIWVQ